MPVPWTEIDKAQVVKWAPMPPQQMPTPPWSDTENHFYRGGQADLGGRVLYLTATGTKDEVRNVHAEDAQTQANRGDVLKVLQQKGFDVQLARCGKLYQLSAAKWYRVTGPGKRPVMLHAQCPLRYGRLPEGTGELHARTRRRVAETAGRRSGGRQWPLPGSLTARHCLLSPARCCWPTRHAATRLILRT